MSELESTNDNYEEVVGNKCEAERVLEKMRELEAKFKPQMRTIRLKDGTIISSTNEDHLRYFLEQDKKSIKVFY